MLRDLFLIELQEGALGSIIPTQSDLEICDNLNTRFSNQIKPNTKKTWLAHLQDHNKREPLFAANRSLVRVAYRLAVSVAGAEVPTIKKHRQRWLHLLRELLPPETDAAIRSVLSAVLDPANNIAYAKFFTQPAPIGLDFELDPENSGAPDLQLDDNGVQYCRVMLNCKTDTELPDPTTSEKDPPKADTNEQPITDSKKPRNKKVKKIVPKKSAAKKPSSKKPSSKKSSAKRSSKKKSTGKKAAAKKARKAKKGRSRH
jgi:hypothetical protein